MKKKHKLTKDFQYISPDKKIFILKTGIILEGYIYRVKNESIPIDKDIIENNPEFFELLDYKSELLSYLKACKIQTPSIIAKKLIPFIEDIILSSSQNNIDPSLIKDIEKRESQVKKKEEEIDNKLKRLEKSEEDIKKILEKEKEFKNRESELIKKESGIEEKNREVDIRLEETKTLMSFIKLRSEELDIREYKLNQPTLPR